MRYILKAEQATQCALAIIALCYQPLQLAWWLWILLFLAPDLSIVGYLFGSRAGAVLYNTAHHKAMAGTLIAVGVVLHFPALLVAGLLLWAHSSFDRIMGYGLKYMDSFHHTHIDTIGQGSRVAN